MEDDFNTPKAIAAIFELINQGNTLLDWNLLSKTETKNILDFFKKIDKFFNFIFWPKTRENIPQIVLDLVKHREEYRKKSDWQKADELRKKIKNLGWQVEDAKDGSRLKRISS